VLDQDRKARDLSIDQGQIAFDTTLAHNGFYDIRQTSDLGLPLKYRRYGSNVDGSATATEVVVGS